mgnify:CR=1 FL=1
MVLMEFEFSEEAKQQIALYNKMGWDKMPICMAKTQMSLSDDAKKIWGTKRIYDYRS